MVLQLASTIDRVIIMRADLPPRRIWTLHPIRNHLSQESIAFQGAKAHCQLKKVPVRILDFEPDFSFYFNPL